MLLREVARADVSKYGVVALQGDGRIQQFQEKPAPEEALSNTINAGVYLFEPSALDLVPSDRPFDIATDFFPAMLESGRPFYGMPLPCTWIDIGRLSDYWLATRMVLNEEINFVHMSGREIAPKVWAGINISLDLSQVTIQGHVSIGSSTVIEPGAVIIGPTVIGRNSVIESGGASSPVSSATTRACRAWPICATRSSAGSSVSISMAAAWTWARRAIRF